MTLDLFPGLTFDQSKKEQNSYQLSYQTSNQTTSTYSPSYMVQIDSPNAGMTKKDVLTQNPNLTPQNVPALTAEQKSGSTGGLGGGLDLTGIAVVGMLVVAGYFLVKK